MGKCLLNRPFVLGMALWAAIMSFPPSNAFAFPSQSLPVGYGSSIRQIQMDKIMSVLSRPEAQIHLRLMGIDHSQLKASLSKLDDAQLADVSRRADAVKAGGDAAGVVIAILVIVLLVVLIVKLMDKRIEITDEKK